jgi:NADH:ubiquinone oxidoreductase subunit 5 (subunit L)/multisubunit Na+/H+ antiporter MnhA subunit
LQANKAALLAVMTNKLGDIALLLGCIALYYSFKSVDFSVLNTCMESLYQNACDDLDYLYVHGQGTYSEMFM